MDIVRALRLPALTKVARSAERVEDREAYQAPLRKGQLDQCAITLLAGKAVGAPIVGSVAACFAISKILRLLHGGLVHELIDLDLRGLGHNRQAASGSA